MKSIRRLYFYLVAFISIEVVTWGLVSLLRSMVNDTISGGAEALAGALALIMVGLWRVRRLDVLGTSRDRGLPLTPRRHDGRSAFFQ